MKVSEMVEAMAWAFSDAHRTGEARKIAEHVRVMEQELAELRAPSAVISVPGKSAQELLDQLRARPCKLEAVQDDLRPRLVQHVRELRRQAHDQKHDYGGETYNLGVGRGLELAADLAGKLLGSGPEMDAALSGAPLTGRDLGHIEKRQRVLERGCKYIWQALRSISENPYNVQHALKAVVETHEAMLREEQGDD